jgi:hypothetical protein
VLTAGNPHAFHFAPASTYSRGLFSVSIYLEASLWEKASDLVPGSLAIAGTNDLQDCVSRRYTGRVVEVN